MEKASGKRKRGSKPNPADPAVDPDRVANVTDPDSGIMKTRHSWLQGYNAQIVVTVGQIILAADVTTDGEAKLGPSIARRTLSISARRAFSICSGVRSGIRAAPSQPH